MESQKGAGIPAGLLDRLEVRALAMDFNRAGKWWDFPGVISPFSRLHLVRKGEAWIRHGPRWCRLRKGDLHLVPCYTRADYHCPASFDNCYLAFTTRIGGGVDLMSLVDPPCRIRTTPRERNFFHELIRINPGRGLTDYDPYKPLEDTIVGRPDLLSPGNALAREVETQALIRLLLGPFLRKVRRERLSRLRELQRLEPALHWIEAHLGEKITVRQLGAIMGLHPTYFSNFFSSLLGVPPTTYINRRRVERAQLILLSTSRSVKEIAVETGFRSPEYFCRTFANVTGLPPREYRRLNRMAPST